MTVKDMENKKVTPLEALEKVKFEKWNFSYCSDDDIEVLEKAIKINPIFQEAIRIDTLIKKTGKTPQQAILKLMEELGELVSALEARDSYKQGSLEHVREESVDVLQCAISVYFLIQQMAPFDGAALMKAKNDKWESKYFTAEYIPHPVYVYEGQSGTGKSHKDPSAHTYTVIIWKDGKEITRLETPDKDLAIGWIDAGGYRLLEVGVEIQVDGEMIDPVTEEELGF